jgi:hypothetical protein
LWNAFFIGDSWKIVGDDISSSSEVSESKDEVAFDDHLEGETYVEDIFPPPPEDELDKGIVGKAVVRREAIKQRCEGKGTQDPASETDGRCMHK